MREVILGKLAEELEGKFIIADLKQLFHNLLATFKSEKQPEDSSKTSGSGTSNVYSSNWNIFKVISFVDVTCNADPCQTHLDTLASQE